MSVYHEITWIERCARDLLEAAKAMREKVDIAEAELAEVSKQAGDSYLESGDDPDELVPISIRAFRALQAGCEERDEWKARVEKAEAELAELREQHRIVVSLPDGEANRVLLKELAELRKGEVPECVRKWRGVSGKQGLMMWLRDQRVAYVEVMADCLEWLDTSAPATIVAASESDVEVLRLWQGGASPLAKGPASALARAAITTLDSADIVPLLRAVRDMYTDSAREYKTLTDVVGHAYDDLPEQWKDLAE